MLTEPTTAAGRAGLAALLHDPRRAVLAFDFDGTLAPIVDDPSQAHPHPRAVAVLADLAAYVGLVAIVTGRPAAQAVELAALRDVAGLEHLVVVGHYGMERWDAKTAEVRSAEPPAGLDVVRDALPGLLERLGLEDAGIEDKGLSIAVHVRGMASPQAAFTALRGPLEQLAAEHKLAAEPGRFVLELRPPGMDKGLALRGLVDEVDARTVVFAGDDLGDLAAFAEVERLRQGHREGLLLCSGSTEVTALADKADLVLDGPGGVAEWIGALVERLSDSSS